MNFWHVRVKRQTVGKIKKKESKCQDLFKGSTEMGEKIAFWLSSFECSNISDGNMKKEQSFAQGVSNLYSYAAKAQMDFFEVYLIDLL